MLNLNWEKIHSIILFVTCHGLRNFPLLIHIPLYPFVNFWNPMSYNFWVWVLTHPTPPHPTPTRHTPPYPTPSWPTPPHPYMTHPTPPHPFMTHPTPPHPFMTYPPTPPHPTPSWHTHPTPPLHDPPTPPHPWYIFGHKGAFFHGLLHYVSLR